MVLVPARAVVGLAAAGPLSLRLAALVLSAALTACGGWWDDQPDAGAASEQAGPAPTPITLSPTILGDLEIDISGIGTQNPTSVVRWDEASQRRQTLSANGRTGINAVTAMAGGLDLKVSTIGTIDSGGFRYLTATFLVRNAPICDIPGTCPGYDVDRTNITLMAAIGTAPGTPPGTPFTRFLKQNNDPAESSLAAQLLPSHGMQTVSGGVAVDSRLASMQLYREAELPSIEGVDLLPYGYVVNHVSNGTRTLGANPPVGQYDGWVTIGYRIPLQPDSANNPFKLTLRIRAVEDSNTRVTQSLEEASLAGDQAVAARAAALGAAEIVMPCNRVAQMSGATPICGARVAGSAASPTTYFDGAPPPTTPKVVSAPINRINLPTDTSIVLRSSHAMNAPTAATLVIDGSMSGRRTLTGAFAGVLDGGTTANPDQLIFKLGATDKPFLRGERVSFTATSGNSSTAGSALARFVGSFLIQGSIAGGGNWPTVQRFDAASGAKATLAGDLNGDGRLDVVVINSGSFSVFLNNGSGGFEAAATTTVASPQFAALGDVNGDGQLDLVIAAGLGATAQLIVYPGVSPATGTGSGGFGTPSASTLGMTAADIVLADFNGDGKLDVAVSSTSNTVIRVRLGDGAGNFGATPISTNLNGPMRMAVGDLDGDGKPDLVLGRASSGQVSVLRALGQGTSPGGGFVATNYPATPLSGTFFCRIAVGDVNGDGNLDVVAALGTTNACTTVTRIAVMLGDGAGALGTPQISEVNASSVLRALVLADLNGDGKLDVVLADDKSLTRLLGNGAGGFGPAVSTLAGTAGESVQSVAVADFTGDGKPDFALATVLGTSGYLTVMVGD